MASTHQQSRSWPFLGHTELGQHLVGMLENQRLPKVMLFTGPRAVGKGSAAIWLMRYGLCQAKENKPCEACPACRQTATGTHPQGFIINPDDNGSIGIEDIRQALRQYELVNWGASSRWLVLIDAERLTEASTNTMLKFLEEIPDHLQIILTTSQPDRLLPTLRSRTSIYQWHFVTPQELQSTSTNRRQIVARSAGRAGWMRNIEETSAFQIDLDQATEMAGQFIHSKTFNRERLPKDRQAVDALVNQQELVARDLLLRSVGSQRRLLWPVEAFNERLPATSAITLAAKYLARYELSANVQPRLLYEDLHLV